jgi:hypothetical protein
MMVRCSSGVALAWLRQRCSWVGQSLDWYQDIFMVMRELSGPGAKERTYVMFKVQLMKGSRSTGAAVNGNRACIPVKIRVASSACDTNAVKMARHVTAQVYSESQKDGERNVGFVSYITGKLSPIK